MFANEGVGTQELRTPRLRLEPLSPSHITPRSVAWLNDVSTVRFSEQRHRSHDVPSSRRWLQELRATGHHAWAIMIATSAVHIGNVVAYVDVHNSLVDLSILIGEKEVTGRGYGFEAWTAVCNHLLEDLQVRKIAAGTMETNEAMLRIMEKSGMIPDGRRCRHLVLDEEEVDVIFAALFRRSGDA